MWNKPDRDIHEEWEDCGDECDEFEVPNKEEERGRVSLPGPKSRIIRKGMMIAVDCEAPDHAFYVAEVIKIRKWSMYVRFYGDKFLKKYEPSFYLDEKDHSKALVSEFLYSANGRTCLEL